MGSILSKCAELEQEKIDLAPTIYNGCQLQESQKDFSANTGLMVQDNLFNGLMGLDYLVLSARVKDPSDLEHIIEYPFEITQEPYGSKVFAKNVSVSYKGAKFCNILYETRLQIIAKNFCTIQYTNESLYRFQEVRSISKLFFEKIGIVVTGIQRMDVFKDANSSIQLEAFRRWFFCNTVNKLGRPTTATPYFNDKTDIRKLTGFTLGTRTRTERYYRYYNKSLEQKNAIKPHIVSAWQENGLSASSDIYRSEIQLSSRFFRNINSENQRMIKQLIKDEISDKMRREWRWYAMDKEKHQLSEESKIKFDALKADLEFDIYKEHSIDWLELTYDESIATLYNIGIKNFAQFVNLDGLQVPDHVYNTLMMSGSEIHVSNFAMLQKQGRKVKKGSVIGLQNFMKGAFRAYYHSQQDQVYLNVIGEMIRFKHFRDHFNKKKLFWIADFEKECYNPDFSQSEMNEYLDAVYEIA